MKEKSPKDLDYQNFDDDIEKLHFQLKLTEKKNYSCIEEKYQDFVKIRLIIYPSIIISFLIYFIMLLIDIFFLFTVSVLIFSSIFCIYAVILEVQFYKFNLLYYSKFDELEKIKNYNIPFQIFLFAILITLSIINLIITLLKSDFFIFLFVIAISVICTYFSSE